MDRAGGPEGDRGARPTLSTPATSLSDRYERTRRRLLRPWPFRAYMLARLPLGACAGLRVRRLDEQGCTVALPGGWRTQNPFGSTYFAAQLMAAELSTGAPALLLTDTATASIALILVGVRASFTKRIVGPSTFIFEDVPGLRATIERTARDGGPETYAGAVVGRNAAGEDVATFEITWSFKRRG